MGGRGFKRYFHDKKDFGQSGGFRGRGGRGGRGRGFGGGPYSNYQGPQSDYRNEGNFGGYRNNRPQNNYNNRNQFWNRPKQNTPGKRLNEVDIGVTQYVSEHEGFKAIIKSRYADFQVSEINLKGEVAKLTDQSLPPKAADEEISEDEDLLINKYNLEILPMETWDKINALIVSNTITEPVEIDVSGMTKEERTKIHEAVKKAFGASIIGSTVNCDDKKVVQFKKYKKGERFDNRVKWVWPGDYVHFIVYKENLDTMDVASQIAEKLKLSVKPAMLGYAGTKDRRAKTTQWFSLRKIDPQKIQSACRSIRDVFVGNYTFSDTNIQLGMLKGNKFRIALRNVVVSDDVVDKACHLLKEHGFINYYGLQRFGSRVETPTYAIGRKLLQNNLQDAVDSILEERPCPYQHALRRYKEEGPQAALRAWGRGGRGALEQRLLRALCSQGADLAAALAKLPRNTFLLYLHSYQSLIWNNAVSERIKRFGLKPAAGDLVPLLDADIEEEIRLEELVPDDDTEIDTDQDGDDKSEHDDADDSKTQLDDKKDDSDKTTSLKDDKKFPVKVLTQEDVDSGKYSILDLIMPLPGYAIEYPPNMKDYYQELLAKDDLKLELRHKIKSYSLSGTYRRVVVVPGSCSWKLVRYSEPFTDLILSDRDELLEKHLSGVIDDGKYKALLLSMTLPASCYATMALRELLRVDTASDNQALQNNYHLTDKGDEVKKESDETKQESDETKQESDETKQESEETMDIQENAEKRKLNSNNDVEAKKLKSDE